MQIKLESNPKVYKYLKSIYGIGNYKAYLICEELGINKNTKYNELSPAKKDNLNSKVGELRRLPQPEGGKTPIEYRLRKYIHHNITNLVNSGSYRGTRHKSSLPARGQRTRSNRQTPRRLNRYSSSI